ncbi:MAG: hypothetical protein IPJ85_07650 [Flavobacteriales bacterium]|nr:hypothetical protein [Flavobacteriales bacterium]
MSQGFVIVAFPLILLACGGAQPTVDPRGVFTGRHYSNDVLGFSLELPPEWDTVSGGRYYNDPGWNAVLDSSIEGRSEIPYKFTHLLAIETTGAQTHCIQSLELLRRDLSVVGNATEYFKHTEEMVSTDSSRFPWWEFSEVRPTSTIGGKEFLMQGTFVWTAPEEKMNRISYCREIGDKLLVFTITDFHYKAALKQAKDLLKKVEWTSSTAN